MLQEVGGFPDLRQQIACPIAVLGPADLSTRVDVEARREVEVVPHGSGNQKRLLLHVHHPRPEAWRVMAGGRLTSKEHVPFIGSIEPTQRP